MAASGETLWRDHLEKARWFQGKGLPFHGLSLTPLPWYIDEGREQGEPARRAGAKEDVEARHADHVPSGDAWVRSELAEVHAGDSSSVYHLLVGYLPPGRGEPEALVGQTDLDGRGLVDVVDAPRSPIAMKALLRALAGGRESGGAGSEVPDSRPATPVIWFERPPDPDSPTRVFEGEQSNTTVLVGDSVLFKVFRKLSVGPNLECEVMQALAGSMIVPRLIGTLFSPDHSYDLGFFSQRVPDAQDGWVYAVDACQASRSIAEQMQGLGAALRALHLSLAEVFPTSQIDSAIISRHMLDRLDAACEQVPELDEVREGLRSILTLPPSKIPVQRVHGDFHLGQALISPAGWTIIDFEGEPLKPPEERAAPDAVWRDVAGLLRSLDYARNTYPHPESDQARQWHSQARSAFLTGYLGSRPLPRDVLAAYEVDKAIYELVYEVRNRPTWAEIPRRAIASALRSHGESTTA